MRLTGAPDFVQWPWRLAGESLPTASLTTTAATEELQAACCLQVPTSLFVSSAEAFLDVVVLNEWCCLSYHCFTLCLGC